MVAAAKEGIDVMVSFDTTGSMFPCLAEVRRKVKRLVERLFDRIPGLRIGIIAHGDYCDRGRTYVLKMLDLSDDVDRIVDFVTNVGPTGGGDAEECYEFVLNQARTASWRAGKSRVLVLIGDDRPHGRGYDLNERGLDWRNEAGLLAEAGVKICAVQCLNMSYADSFYRSLAELSGGLRLPLNQFAHIEDLLAGLALREESMDAFAEYERDVRRAGRYSAGVEVIFDRLAGRASRARKSGLTGMSPVDPARFQVFEVTGKPSIRDFVTSMGIRFEKGRGFYPLVTRPETIQEEKEVILEDLETGELFTGPEVRERIGLPYGVRGTVKPWPLGARYRLWVQSTSVNRALRDPWFMYEVPEKMGSRTVTKAAPKAGKRGRADASRPPKGMKPVRARSR